MKRLIVDAAWWLTVAWLAFSSVVGTVAIISGGCWN